MFSLSLLLPFMAVAGPPPVITAQPLDQGVALGGTASFTVTASSGTALTYQWYKDGLLDLDVALAGQTSNTLTIANVGLLDPGTFYVVVKNAGGSVASRHASLSLVLLNSAPVGNNDTYSTPEDTVLIIPSAGVLANDTDVDNNALTAVLVNNVTRGSLTLGAHGQFIYVPSTNFFGSDSFTYYPHDGSVAGNTVTVTINVIPVNDAPVARNDAYTISEDRTLMVPVSGVLSTGAPGAGVLANDTDVEGDTLTAILVNSVSHGTLMLNSDGSFSYAPNPDFNGTDSFTYRASDGLSQGNLATVTIEVTRVSDPLRFVSTQMTPSGFELQIAGDAAPYVILASTDLQNWTPLFTNAAPSGTVTYTDSTAATYPNRFYRVDTR